MIHVESDCGEGYVKALGNPEGPHALASEFVGTQLAEWFDLPVFDYALVSLTDDDELPFSRGGQAESGPAFISRAETGFTWGGDEWTLKKLANPADLSRLVVFDTWIRNRDRHHPDPEARAPNLDNVFLSKDGVDNDSFILKAIDHTHCFGSTVDLSPRLAHLDEIQDPAVYGLFPEFRGLIDRAQIVSAAADLRGLDRSDVEAMVARVPRGWDVNRTTRTAWVRLICERAIFVANNVVEWIYPQSELPLGGE